MTGLAADLNIVLAASCEHVRTAWTWPAPWFLRVSVTKLPIRMNESLDCRNGIPAGCDDQISEHEVHRISPFGSGGSLRPLPVANVPMDAYEFERGGGAIS
jgi:hypothetical protein